MTQMMEVPHPLNCTCRDCRQERTADVAAYVRNVLDLFYRAENNMVRRNHDRDANGEQD